MADKETPGRYEVTEGQINTALERVQRSFPAIVVSYDAQTMRAEVQPALRIRSKNGQQTTPTVVTIPVDWMSWGDHVIQGVLTQGDEVVVECMDRNWLAWLEAGGVADYNAIGGRQAGYAVAKPRQLSSGKRPGPLGAGEAVKIGRRDGLTTVVLMSDGRVRIQATEVEMTAGAGFSDFLTSLHTSIAGWVPVANDGGAALKTALAGWLAKTPPTGGPPP
jgi:hypothetical protein